MFTLVSTKSVASDHYLLTLQSEVLASQPGQFINIKVTNNTDPLIRRPFSIFDHSGTNLQIVVRVVGKATRQIAALHPGAIDCIGPSGKGFAIVTGKKALLIGGGVGNAPLFYCAKKLREHNSTVTYIYGATSQNTIYMLDDYKNISNELIVVTDDGSAGVEGNPVDIARAIIKTNSFDMIYTCGPEIMMQRITQELSPIPIQASLERYFGCGIGLCSGCTVATKNGYRRACIDGPVFDAYDVLWDKP